MRISKLHLAVCAAALCAGVTAVHADDNPEQAAARAALEAKMRELNAAPATNNTPAPAATTPPAQTQTASRTSTASNSDGLFGPVPPPSGSLPTIIQPGESQQSPTTAQTTTTIPAPSPVFTESPPPPNKPYPGEQLGFKPIMAPPLPITPTQQAELQALLEKYDANTITPEQYQAARAKILHGR